MLTIADTLIYTHTQTYYRTNQSRCLLRLSKDVRVFITDRREPKLEKKMNRRPFCVILSPRALRSEKGINVVRYVYTPNDFIIIILVVLYFRVDPIKFRLILKSNSGWSIPYPEIN